MADRMPDIAVVGAGLVGTALALGLARGGARVALCDAPQDDLHASVANFGLVWVQGKGLAAPAYAALTRRAAEAWPALSETLAAQTGIATAYRRSGGLRLALSEAEMERRAAEVQRLHNQPGGANDARLIDRAEVARMLPGIGPEVAGAVWCPHDGHADPLATLRALHSAVRGQVQMVPERIRHITPRQGGFVLEGAHHRLAAGRVVLAAGLGNATLGPMLGIPAPVRPQRGQILVTARLPRFLDIACHVVRQTADGTVLIGDSKEEVGHDRGTTRAAAAAIAGRAVRMFPRLAQAPVVRAWGGLRVLSPDGLPIYASSERFPGAHLVTCHSGVTLAAAHAGEVAEAILADRLAAAYPAFGPGRLQVAA